MHDCTTKKQKGCVVLPRIHTCLGQKFSCLIYGYRLEAAILITRSCSGESGVIHVRSQALLRKLARKVLVHHNSKNFPSLCPILSVLGLGWQLWDVEFTTLGRRLTCWRTCQATALRFAALDSGNPWAPIMHLYVQAGYRVLLKSNRWVS